MQQLPAFVLLSSIVLLSTAGAAEEPIVVVRNGVAGLPIVSGSVGEPVAELRDYLQRISGAAFEVAEPARGKKGIYVGLAADFPWVEIDRADELGAEGFVIRSEGGNVFLVAAAPLGVRHAVTTFLNRLGCRWFFPGEAWEVVPERETIVGLWDARQVPDFPTQRRIWYGFGAYAEGRRDLVEWERHNRMGGPVEVSIGHTWHGLQPEKEFAENPEWFALVDGKRQPTKPCYSHPQVIARGIESALLQAAKGSGMVSATPPDGLGYCECERCLAVFRGAEPSREHGTLFARRPDGAQVNVTSETLFAFVNAVAAAVAKKYQQTMVGCYAYSAYSHPPSFRLHPNVYLQTTTAFRRTPIDLAEQLGQFGEKTEQLGIREYYSVYQWDWDYPDPGKMEPGQIARDLKFFRGHGITAINAEASNNWAARGLGYYVASQLMWDVDSDIPELLRDFYRGAFGPAAIPMQRYYVRWFGPGVAVLDGARDLPEQSAVYEKGSIDVEVLKAAFRDLDAAVGAVPAGSSYRVRVDQLRMYLHYLFLRYRLQVAESGGQANEIIEAIKAETQFGGRLAKLNIIHSRPLIGKAFLRRFGKHGDLLAGIDAAQQSGKGWREVGEPPTREELDSLWATDEEQLGLR